NLADVQPVQRLRAVGRELDVVALEGKRSPQRLADGRFVVDDKNLGAVHARIVASKIERRLRALDSTRPWDPRRLARGRQEVGRGEAAIRGDGGRSHTTQASQPH